jgi:hypothetical protein
MKNITYSEYNEIKDILQRSNVENSYELLMKKEEKVLDTVNQVVKYYKDQDIRENEFVNQNVYTIISKLGETWKDILEDAFLVKSASDFYYLFIKEDRIIYIGISMVIVALFLFLIESSSKW